MDAVVLILAGVLSFPLYWIRRKKYQLRGNTVLLIYVTFFVIGAVGACVGSWIAGGLITGKRLYGMILFDTITIIMLSKLLKIDLGKLGDFVALPTMAVCFSTKIDCIIHDCCTGFVMYQPEMAQPVRFPSAIFEMVIWGALSIMLYVLEIKGRSTNMLYPIMLIWFGALRYTVDFLRGSALEKEPFFFSMPGGRFWSLVVLLSGCIYLYYALQSNFKKRPSVRNFLASLVGMKIH